MVVSLWFLCGFNVGFFWFLLCLPVVFELIICLNILRIVLRIILRALDCDLWLPKVGGYI